MKTLHRISHSCYRPALGLLLIRVVTGGIFAHHGWMKLQNITGTGHFFSMLGLPLFMVYIVALIELIGGLMLVFGIISRAAAVATGIVALFAAILAVIPKGGLFGAEFELLLAAVSFGLALNGSGKYRLLHLFEHDHETKEVSRIANTV